METKPSLLRFWTTASTSGLTIRVEWTAGSKTESSYGRYFADDHEINWQYETPPEAIEALALEAAASDGDYTVPGAEWQGNETYAEMDRQCAARCQGCGVVQESEEGLSEDGRCSRCFVAAKAVA